MRDDLVKADADLVCESFNRQVVPQLMAWNFPGAALPRVARDEENEDLSARSERDDRINKWGFKPRWPMSPRPWRRVDGNETAHACSGTGQTATPSAIDGATFADPPAWQ